MGTSTATGGNMRFERIQNARFSPPAWRGNPGEGVAGEGAEHERGEGVAGRDDEAVDEGLQVGPLGETSLKFSGCHTSGQKVGIVRLVSAASFRAVMICSRTETV